MALPCVGMAMEAVLIKHLKKIQAEPSVKPKGISEDIDRLLVVLNETVGTNAKTGQSPRYKNADSHFAILHDICESKHPRMVELTLSCIHVLIERGYLQGKSSIAGDGMLLEARGEVKERALACVRARRAPTGVKKTSRRAPSGRREGHTWHDGVVVVVARVVGAGGAHARA